MGKLTGGRCRRRSGVASDGVRGGRRHAVEELLAGIWADVLQVEQSGMHDNFFDLGGHSLLATQVMSRVRDAFQTEVAVRTLFESADDGEPC